MIFYIEADGFRSLVGLRLELKPGLNILVGPNGGGKTNIISLFQFISRIVRSSLGEAVIQTGGAGSIFQKISFSEYRSDLRICVMGHTKANRALTGEEGHEGITYRYEIVIRLSETKDFIFYQTQNLAVSFGAIQQELLRGPFNRDRWDFWVHQSIDSENKVRFNLDFDGRRFRTPRFLRRYLLHYSQIEEPLADDSASNKEKIKGLALSVLKREATADQSLLRGTAIDFFMQVAEDLIGGETLNIDPSAVRRTEDGARPPGIAPDGSGLTATLFHLSRQKSQAHAGVGSGPRVFRPLLARSLQSQRNLIRFLPKAFEQIVGLMRLVNPSSGLLPVWLTPP